MFYFAQQNLFEPLSMIEVVGHTQTTGQFNWISGVKFDRPLPRQVLELDPAYGTDFPDFFDTTIPLMSERLLQAFRSAEVDNIDVYPMTLKRIDTGELFEDYSAVNVVGSVDAVDLGNSEYRLELGDPYFTGRITIDPNKTRGLEVFRLPYGPGLIVVSERIAALLKRGAFRALLLQPTQDYSGS